MKVIPKDELILLLQAGKGNMVSLGEINQLFETYGDDYTRAYYGYRHYCNTWEQTTENEYRKAKVVLAKAQDTINNLPSAQTERKKGRWISDRLVTTIGSTYGVRRCSLCEAYYQDVGYGFHYCPNCGAEMDEVTE